MVDTEEKMIPTDALRTIKRLRAVGPCRIDVQFDARLDTDTNRPPHSYPARIDGLTMQQVTHLLEDLQRLHDTVREISEDVPLVTVKITDSEDTHGKTVVLC